MDHRLALNQLDALIKLKGSLRIITAEVRPELRVDKTDPRSPAKPELLVLDPDMMEHARTFVIHDAIRLERRDSGLVRAYSAEGDWCQGYPADLLGRLTEANREGA